MSLVGGGLIAGDSLAALGARHLGARAQLHEVARAPSDGPMDLAAPDPLEIVQGSFHGHPSPCPLDVAIALTLVFSVWQRVSGPTYPIYGSGDAERRPRSSTSSSARTRAPATTSSS